MTWRRIRLPLALVLLGAAIYLGIRRSEEVQAVLLELETAEQVPAARRAAVREAFPATPVARLEEVVSGLDRPLFVTHASDGSGRLFVVLQGGTIRVIADGKLLPTPFLDVTTQLDTSGGERGLLGLAFAPDYPQSGVFYIAHTSRGPAGLVRRLRVSSDPNRADADSAQLVLSMEDPAGNHNGGMLAFGPDGMLWIGTGDGGSAGDPWNNAQTPESLLGKMLRIDVRTAPYVVPPDNPFVGRRGYRPEIWATGLRNPWRYSFDRATGELWIGDVGQFQWEEIDVVDPKRTDGPNFGWKRMEGNQCYAPKSGCDSAGLELPIHDYDHDHGCSVTGGYVYRGSRIPALVGRYLFGDYCRGTVWELERRPGGATEVRPLLQARSISSFGEDEAGELYLTDHAGGRVLRFVAASP